LTLRFYNIVRTLFPALPQPKDHDYFNDSKDRVSTSPASLLYPIFLPSIHSTIFTLFALKEQKSDSLYWERILRWNRHSDLSLLTFLEVEPSFQRHSLTSTARDKHFLTAIHCLQRLKTTFSPCDKLQVVVEMFRDITSQGREGGGQFTWSMDALLPVCMYVVVRAKILHLGAELSMVQELMDSSFLQGEQGIMLTTLQAAYYQMLNESVFIN